MSGWEWNPLNVGLLILQVIALCVAVALTRTFVRRMRGRHTRRYLQQLRDRGVLLLFSPSAADVMGGLQLLARFGIRDPSSHLLTRLAVLASDSDPGMSALANRILRNINAVESRLPSSLP
jgi:hypothetical protein